MVLYAWNYNLTIQNEYDSGADTDTVPSIGEDMHADTDKTRHNDEHLHYLFWAYHMAKGAWRKATHKPTRNGNG